MKLGRLIVVIVILATYFCLAFGVPEAYADRKLQGQKKKSAEPKVLKEVLVKVRAIKGSHPVKEEKSESKELVIDKRLDDISAKFDSFDFRSFKMISEQEMTIPVKKKTEINLTEKTVLILRPVYSDDKRVGMWIKWVDSSGDRTLLDTRMHFESAEPMLAGTNCKDNKALILAISAVPNK